MRPVVRTLAMLSLLLTAGILMADPAPKQVKPPVTEGDVRLVEYDVSLNEGVPASEAVTVLKRIAANHRAFAASIDEKTRHAVMVVPVSRVRELSKEPLVKSAAPAASSPNGRRIEQMKPVAMTSTPWNSGAYQYDGSGNIKNIGSDAYSYDGVGRLLTSTTNGAGQSFQYDEFGNRTSATILNGQCTGAYDCAIQVAVDGTTNRLQSTTLLGQTTNASYDNAGNMTSFNGVTFSWDALGMMTGRSDGGGGRQFVYDENDERIGSFYATNWSWTIRDINGRVLREYSTGTSLDSPPWGSNAWNWHNDQIYRGGQPLASVGNQSPYGGYQPVTQHLHLDHLGSPRLVTVGGGETAFHYYLPFGTEIATAPIENPSEDNHKFTGHEAENINNGVFRTFYMHARYYNATAGRFFSVDPLLGKPQQPQHWNRYAYVNNNPIGVSDPTGKCGEPATFVGPTQPCASFREYMDKRKAFQGQQLAALREHARKHPMISPAQDAIHPTGVELIVAAPLAGALRGAAAGAVASEAGEAALSGEAEGGGVQIFRAVGREEMQSIRNSGTYGSAPSMNGKYFALSEQGASDFANTTYNAGRELTITSTTVPRSVFNQGFLLNDPGGAGPSIFFSQDFLDTLYSSMSEIQIH